MVYNKNMVEDEHHLLLACPTHKIIHKKYDELLHGHDNLSGILKSPPRRVSTYVCALFSNREFFTTEY